MDEHVQMLHLLGQRQELLRGDDVQLQGMSAGITHAFRCDPSPQLKNVSNKATQMQRKDKTRLALASR